MIILSKTLSLLSLSGLEDIIFMIGNIIKRIINIANLENQNIELFNNDTEVWIFIIFFDNHTKNRFFLIINEKKDKGFKLIPTKTLTREEINI